MPRVYGTPEEAVRENPKDAQRSGGGGTPGAATHTPVTASRSVPDGHCGTHWNPGVVASSICPGGQVSAATAVTGATAENSPMAAEIITVRTPPAMATNPLACPCASDDRNVGTVVFSVATTPGASA